MPGVKVGVDVGGTFTDLVALDESTGRLWRVKVPTRPRNPVAGVLEALDSLGSSLEGVTVIVHATTLGTNMFLGQAGLEPQGPPS